MKSTIEVSTNMSIVVRPQNVMPMKLNDFTVWPINIKLYVDWSYPRCIRTLPVWG